MSDERAIALPGWPPPDAGAPTPVVLANDTALFIRYYTNTEKTAVIHFPLCSVFTFGEPNDEALAGHPLYGRGLEFYSIHYVENSSWITELERRNSVHHRHDRELFLKDKRHYIFTFHDSTLECVVREGKFWPVEITEFATDAEADIYVRSKWKQ